MSELTTNMGRGVISGAVATVALSLLMVIGSALPQLMHAQLLNNLVHGVLEHYGLEAFPLAGWIWHFLIGTLWWGSLFAVVEPILPGRTPGRKGISFGAGCGFVVLVALIPLAAAGAFGMELSFLTVVVTALQHLAYGYVLGEVYGRLSPSMAPTLHGTG